ncbi:MAG: efflux RND transporter permease subunit [Acidobacteriota bacterium]
MRRLIHWFAANGVAANLLMMLIIALGLMAAWGLRKEVFPEFSADRISVVVPYPGAAPAEVERGVVLRIEEAIQDLQDIKKIESTAAENSASVIAELERGADAQKLLNEIKSRVDGIDTFPDEAEEPVIEEVILRRQVINVAVSGDADERTLKTLAEGVREEILALPGITQVEVAVTRPDEISVEVSEQALRRWGLTFDDVAGAVRRSSLDIPGGEIETRGGEILLRTEGQAYDADAFAGLPVLALPDGRRVHLGEIATIVDGFADTDVQARFNGQPTALVQVFRVGEQSAIYVADTVKDYVAEAQASLPQGIALTTWQDDSQVLRSRLGLLIRSGRAGFALVFLTLALFLRLKLAGWTTLGIPISFLGAFAFMPVVDVSINLISLFAFIIVLGIVVDDAIVVGENIYAEFEKGKEGLQAAVDGANRVAIPVTFAILTTIAAFAPLLNVPGSTGKIMRVIPLIVIATLVFSLIESLLVLPNHLSHLKHTEEKQPGALRRRWQTIQRAFSRRLQWLVENAYRPFLERAIEQRYLTLSTTLAVLMVTFAVVIGGWVRFSFLPPTEADNVVAILEMPQGTPAEITIAAVEDLEREVFALLAELEEEEGEKIFQNVSTTIGAQPYRSDQSRGAGGVGQDYSGGHLGEVNVELTPAEDRRLTSPELARQWRERAPAIPAAESLTFSAALFSAGDAVNVQMSGADGERLQTVASRLKEELRNYPGVQDIADSYRAGKQEIELDITAEGEAAGLTLSDLGRQVRQAFYGEEAQRLQRGREDVRVMVRFPAQERRSLADLESMWLRTPDGGTIPFTTAARASLSRGPSSIRRIDRRQVVNVTADVDPDKANSAQIIASLEGEVLPRLLRDYPDVRYTFEGEQQEQRDSFGGLIRGFIIAMFAIYALLAVPFRSYLQPLIVMAVIPFGLIGAVFGHVLMGINLTILSFFGIVALTGVVVNDSLVMVDWINRAHRQGTPLRQAIREAGAARFRPIILTSLTTFVGLLPLLLEESMQAQFLIPMATSLAFGVLFATFITLVLVPTLYHVLEDLVRGARPVKEEEGEETLATEGALEPIPAEG